MAEAAGLRAKLPFLARNLLNGQAKILPVGTGEPGGPVAAAAGLSHRKATVPVQAGGVVPAVVHASVTGSGGAGGAATVSGGGLTAFVADTGKLDVKAGPEEAWAR